MVKCPLIDGKTEEEIIQLRTGWLSVTLLDVKVFGHRDVGAEDYIKLHLFYHLIVTNLNAAFFSSTRGGR
jgi:hypothetical protein